MPGLVVQREEPSWVRYVKQRISQNKNFIGFISGPTGSGKSWASLAIAEMIDPEFTMERCVFGADEFMELLNGGKLKKGSCIIWEESGVTLSSKNWQSLTNKVINFVMQTFRHRNFILIMNAPYMDYADSSTRKLFHAELQTMTINREKQTVKLKPQLLQYNSRMRKFYYKYLRVITPQGVVPVKRWNIPKPSKELLDAYEKRKREFTDALNKDIQEDILREKGKNSKDREITEVQREVLQGLKNGLNFKEVAERRGTTDNAVSTCVKGLRRRGYTIKPVFESGKLVRYRVFAPGEKVKSSSSGGDGAL